MSNKAKNKATKVELTNVAPTVNNDVLTVTEEKKEVQIDSLLKRKHLNVDYANMSAKDQKAQRSKNRLRLFNLIEERERLILSKEKDSAKFEVNFEAFKTFVSSTYNIPLTNVESVFSGSNEGKKERFTMYVAAFKEYLAK